MKRREFVLSSRALVSMPAWAQEERVSVFRGARAMMPWDGVAGTMKRAKEGGIVRQGRLYRFDVDGRVVPLA